MNSLKYQNQYDVNASHTPESESLPVGSSQLYSIEYGSSSTAHRPLAHPKPTPSNRILQ